MAGQKKRRIPTLALRVAVAHSRLAVMQAGSWRTSAQTSSQRGYGYRWQKERAAYLQQHPFCVYCLRAAGINAVSIEAIIMACADKVVPLPYAIVVDHRTPHRGDQALFWDRSNWQPLCARHHSSDKQREEAAAIVEGSCYPGK